MPARPQVPWLELTESGYVVDAAVLAGKFGLTVEDARAAMRGGRLVTISESGEGEDAGRTRLTFRHGASVWRILIEPDGTVSEDFEIHARRRPGGTPHER